MNPISSTLNLIGSGIETLSFQPGSEAEILHHATQLEGVFMSMLIKEMRNTIEEGGFFGSESSDSYGSLFDLYLGQHLAETQPLGIAQMWLSQYRQNADDSTKDDSNSITLTL